MTFSEVTDAFVEGGVKSAGAAWNLAKQRKLAGDDTLYSTLGAQDVRALVAKVLCAWRCSDPMSDTLIMPATFSLESFRSLDELRRLLQVWVTDKYQTTSERRSWRAVLCHLSHRTMVFTLSVKVDRLRDLVFVEGQSLVIDEACLHHRTIDDAKDLLDVAKSRDITCCNRDGRIPAGTPRIFSTNWGHEGFPPDARFSLHKKAIHRCILWVAIESDLRVAALQIIPNGHDHDSAGENEVDGCLWQRRRPRLIRVQICTWAKRHARVWC